MSGLYFLGMKMPKNCDECWKKFHGFGWVEHDEEWGIFYCKAGKGFCSDPRTKCPIVVVPDHGDLIDKVAFREEMDKHYPVDKLTQSKHGEADDAKRTIIKMLINFLSVIPAEKEGQA